MQPSVWLLLERQISAGDFVPGEILVSAGPLGARTQSLRVEGGVGWGEGWPRSVWKKGGIFALKPPVSVSVHPQTGACAQRGIGVDMLSCCLLNGLVTTGCVSPGGTFGCSLELRSHQNPAGSTAPPPTAYLQPGVNMQRQRRCRRKQSRSLLNPFTSSFQSLAMVHYHAAPINLLGGAKHFLTF